MLSLWSCSRLLSVYEIVAVPYVDEVVAVTVMHVLFSVVFVACVSSEIV